MKFTRQDIEKVYDEFDRRMHIDIVDGTIPDCIELKYTYSDRLQGVYGTIMALASDANWREVVWWIDEIENERYGYRAGHGIVEYGNK